MNALAAMHVARKQLGLDEDTYRDTLQRLTGKRSGRDMSEAERHTVVEHFRQAGFRTASEVASRPARSRLAGPYAPKLQALWIAGWHLGLIADRTDAALLAFVKRQTGIDHVRFLRHAEDASKAVEALKAWLARDGGIDWSVDRTAPRWTQAPGARVARAQYAKLVAAGRMPSDGHETFEVDAAASIARPLDQADGADWIKLMRYYGALIRSLPKRRP